MRHVQFSNEGLIDLRGVTTFGASSKETKSPIGYFGTGLKYAIAVALRLGCKVTLYRGEEKYTFHTKTTKIRVDEFEIIHMEGPEDGQIRELAFTTELGKNWDAWQAFRELWCNAVDEGGFVSSGPVEKPDPGRTIVEIQGAPFVECYNTRENIMLQSSPKWLSDGVEISFKESSHGYYRGVRVLDLQKRAMLTYNVVAYSLDLTEDRTLKYPYMFNAFVADSLAKTDDEQLIKELLEAPQGSFEADILSFADVTPGKALLAALETVNFKTVNNASLFRLYSKQKGKNIRPERIEPETDEGRKIDEALGLLRVLGYEVGAYKINVTDGLDDNRLGQAYDGEIWISRRCLTMGATMVAGTILEEFVHLHHGLRDCSREMQNWFIDALISTAERLRGDKS